MALTEFKKIAIWATTKQAFRLLWAARLQHAVLSPLAVLPFIVMGLLGWLDPIFTPPAIGTAPPPEYIRAELLFMGWMLLWLIPFSLLWQRLFLVGPHLFLKLTAEQLLKMWLRLLGYYLALALLLAGLAILFLGASSGLVTLWQYAFGITEASVAVTTAEFAALVFAFCALLIVMRLMPAFVSVAVRENIPPRAAWNLMKDNASLLLLVSILVMLPVSAVSNLITGQLVALVNAAGGDGTAVQIPGAGAYLVILGLSPLISAAAALQLAAMAIVYRDLAPQPEHQLDITV